ncbi:MAG: GNAT family N-acetyltransferase [Chloroflexota bacterium]|nr:MAG: GNAT family N-acetyltransferase [Chloroflexota bacterium]
MLIAYLADHPQHLKTVAAWLYNEWGRHNPESSLEKIEARLGGHLNRDAMPMTLIALDGERPVGTAALQASDMSTRRELTPWLAAVYVDPEHRNRGAGSELVRAVEAEARKLGIQRLYLFTPDRDQFYTRLGWRVLENTEYRSKQVVIMDKML